MRWAAVAGRCSAQHYVEAAGGGTRWRQQGALVPYTQRMELVYTCAPAPACTGFLQEPRL
jgi:hypothetical protein